MWQIACIGLRSAGLGNHAHGNAGVTVDALLFARSGVSSRLSIGPKDIDGKAMHSGADSCRRGVSDLGVVFPEEHVAAVMNAALNDPVSPTQVEELGVGTLLAATDEVKESFFLMAVAEVVAVTAQEDHLLSKGKVCFFCASVPDLYLSGFNPPPLFTYVGDRGGKTARRAEAAVPFSASWVGCL